MADDRIRNIVIVGGGSAGWLVAAILASRFETREPEGLTVTLIESGEIPTLGVGEGTWPSMRSTLKKVGISETEFIASCDASFKQGSKFLGWQPGNSHVYYHPFQLPSGNCDDIAMMIGGALPQGRYAEFVCPQVALDHSHLAPKLITSADYTHTVNYGYHLDASKFSALLREHSVNALGVKHLVETVTGIETDEQDRISHLITQSGRKIEGDLFVDCSGFSSILMKGHYAIPFVDCNQYLFNDSAIAVQVPYEMADDAIQSYTLSTAQCAGWIWDIGLKTRRGVGYTYSSAHCTAEQARNDLEAYVKSISISWQDLTYRDIKFNPGYLQKFWHKNCIAIGVSSGFLEPLEASALVTVELAAEMLAENMPATHSVMGLIQNKFNDRFVRHWQHIIEFLKLHYVLSKRERADYWEDNRQKGSMPDSLVEKLDFWEHFPPSRYDDMGLRELFPAASYQYVLYGMDYACNGSVVRRRSSEAAVIRRMEEERRKVASMVRSLPTNRQLLNAIGIHGRPDLRKVSS